jgi:hypothetical protein
MYSFPQGQVAEDVQSGVPTIDEERSGPHEHVEHTGNCDERARDVR